MDIIEAEETRRKYIIVQKYVNKNYDEDIYNFEKDVARKMEAGYVPTGGIRIDQISRFEKNYIVYSQAMYLKE